MPKAVTYHEPAVMVHTPKAVAYHEPAVMWLVMIGHSLWRMEICFDMGSQHLPSVVGPKHGSNPASKKFKPHLFYDSSFNSFL